MKASSIRLNLDSVESIGKTIVDKLNDALWYIESHREKFKQWHLVISFSFTKYHGFNYYRKNHKSKTYNQANELDAYIGSLVSILGMPF